MTRLLAFALSLLMSAGAFAEAPTMAPGTRWAPLPGSNSLWQRSVVSVELAPIKDLPLASSLSIRVNGVKAWIGMAMDPASKTGYLVQTPEGGDPEFFPLSSLPLTKKPFEFRGRGLHLKVKLKIPLRKSVAKIFDGASDAVLINITAMRAHATLRALGTSVRLSGKEYLVLHGSVPGKDEDYVLVLELKSKGGISVFGRFSLAAPKDCKFPLSCKLSEDKKTLKLSTLKGLRWLQ